MLSVAEADPDALEAVEPPAGVEPAGSSDKPLSVVLGVPDELGVLDASDVFESLG